MTPGRRLQVTVTVPEGFNKLLVVEGLTVNGTPIQTVEEQRRTPRRSTTGNTGISVRIY